MILKLIHIQTFISLITLKLMFLQIDENLTHNYQDCLTKSFGIPGYNCEDKFCDWLFTDENINSTVIAHNGSGYDNKFILQYCLNKGIIPSSFIRQGSRITYMSFKRYRIRFIDSYNFVLQPLKKLSKTYDIDTLKGHVPHHLINLKIKIILVKFLLNHISVLNI